MARRAWIFTINNPTSSSSGEYLKLLTLPVEIQYLVYQAEKGDSGTPHYQGYLILKDRTTLRATKAKIAALFGVDIDRPHLEPRRGTHDQAKAYCTKQETRISEPVELGVPDKQGKRSDLADVCNKILGGKRVHDFLNENTTTIVKYHRGLEYVSFLADATEAKKLRMEIKTVVLTGPTGVGKTRFVFDRHDIDDIYILNITSERIWFDGYMRNKVLLIDDFNGNIKYHYLLRLLDIYPMQVEIKGGYTWAFWTTVYITSNRTPHEWYSKSMGDVCPEPLWRRIFNWTEFDENGDQTVKKPIPRIDDEAILYTPASPQ